MAAQQMKKDDSSGDEMGSTIWMDYHSKSPESPYSHVAQLQSDVLYALEIVAKPPLLILVGEIMSLQRYLQSEAT